MFIVNDGVEITNFTFLVESDPTIPGFLLEEK